MVDNAGHKDAPLPQFLASHPAIHERAHCAQEGK
jgi:hypothetical protein